MLNNPKPVIRGINTEDILSFNNGELYKESLRGLTAEIDGRPVAIAGILHTSPLQVFSTMRDEMRQYPVSIMKMAVALKSIMKTYECDLLAIADENESNSDAFLQRLGFVFIGENDNGRFYKWVQ